MVFDLTRDLEGTWALSRWVQDRIQGQKWTMEGQATFLPREQFLDYREEGRLLGPHEGPFDRVYRWQVTSPTQAQVFFEDGRPFVSLTFQKGRATATHPCGADTYEGSFDFSSPTILKQTWRVHGPQKDLCIETALRIHKNLTD